MGYKHPSRSAWCVHHLRSPYKAATGQVVPLSLDITSLEFTAVISFAAGANLRSTRWVVISGESTHWMRIIQHPSFMCFVWNDSSKRIRNHCWNFSEPPSHGLTLSENLEHLGTRTVRRTQLNRLAAWPTTQNSSTRWTKWSIFFAEDSWILYTVCNVM